MPNYHIPLFPEKTYHILSRAVGSEKLFMVEDNYRYFLEQYHNKVGAVAELMAYCLIPNHFHFMVRIKSEQEIRMVFEKAKPGKIYNPEFCADFIMERFSNWLNGYTRAFNIKFKRKGALFIDYLRRVDIEHDGQFSATLFYIHKNPVHHGLVKGIGDWKWSSYKAILSNSPTRLPGNYILEWFGGQEQYERFHSQPIDLKHDGEML